MILDRLDRADRYAALHPGFATAFAYLRQTDFSQVDVGRHALDGERLAAILARNPGRERGGPPLESHRRYIDIQYVVSGVDAIGWRSLADCHKEVEPYNSERDIGFFADAPETWLKVPAGHFAIFFPEDAHAPLAGLVENYKAVMKVAVEW